MIRLAARLNRALAESRAFCCAITACARVGGLGLAVAYLARTMMSLPEVIRTRSLMVADQKFDIRELRYQGRRVHFAESHLGMLREIFGRRVYDREMATRPFGTVIDLGASSGFFTLYAIASGADKVYAVDAQMEVLGVLKENIRLNRLADKVVVECCAVGASVGAMRSTVKEQGIRVEALGSLLCKWGIVHVDFLKVDIEGSEFDLFASPDIERWLPLTDRVALEYHRAYGNPRDISEILRRSGFSVVERPNSAESDQFGYIVASRQEDLVCSAGN